MNQANPPDERAPAVPGEFDEPLPGFEYPGVRAPLERRHDGPSDVAVAGTGGTAVDRRSRARGSALWAAYGDALGFISELTDERGLRRRTGDRPLNGLMSWSRRVGGRGGVITELPAGSYSDDTQLRLATGRAVSGKGFDVEAFAKIELPVWPSYSLGGGRATKAACANLARPRVGWFANSYDGWLEAGGNGVAMRIQPHVWAAAGLQNPLRLLGDVLRNGICTHGNPRALFGAALHALCLAHAMGSGAVPAPKDVPMLLERADSIDDVLDNDPELTEMWLPLWERSANERFTDAWHQAGAETREAFDIVTPIVRSSDDGPQAAYQAILRELGLYKDSSRGSGTLTVVASTTLAWLEPRPLDAMRIAANAIGSDTDTIATMAGAVLGAASPVELPEPVLDRALIVRESDRLTDVAMGQGGLGPDYPDLLTWSAPRTQADALQRTETGMAVVGLGPVRTALKDPQAGPRGDIAWQWVKLESDQTLLIKRRKALPALSPESETPVPLVGQTLLMGSPALKGPAPSVPATYPDPPVLTQPFEHAGQRVDDESRPPAPDLDVILGWLEHKQFDDDSIGYSVRQVATKGSHDQLIALVSVVRDRLRQAR
ncbi:ADP-ribosylglycohydrolase family protein [Actinomadura xylanilytica]|uniref:ADP-ribosylglycohydrolase family protein n=1 Tax=Actinomadura xylanilytica TaxID=887459 RepID=UPI00255A9A2A|nr:ADP-ribosylglycohydrolase family protein [Actinomadura xylanilytica]MDL4774542.1 ADP-ribosylglycohydrolase family protein [Actinomadura xylanilytica]